MLSPRAIQNALTLAAIEPIDWNQAAAVWLWSDSNTLYKTAARGDEVYLSCVRNPDASDSRSESV